MSDSNRNRFHILNGIGFYCTAGPNTALIKSSRDCAVSITVGGRLPYIPVFERIDKLNLKLRTIMVETESETLDGIPAIVKGCMQFKIPGWSEYKDGLGELSGRISKNALETKNNEMSINESAIKLAAQHFLGKGDEEINNLVLKTVTGHQRAITGALAFIEIDEGRDKFLEQVIDICSRDLKKMGLVVVSYTLSDVSDKIGYSFNRGVPEGEKVRRDAIEGTVIHQNATISKAAKEEANSYLIAKQQEQKKIESDKHTEVKLLETQRVVNEQKAIQEKAHSIVSAEQDAILFARRKRAEEKEVEAELGVMRQKNRREKLKQERLIHVDADSRLYKLKIEARKIKEMASAEAEKIRLLGNAEGEAIESHGLAEMNVLRERNEIWKER